MKTPTHARKLQGPRRTADDYARFLESKGDLVPQVGFERAITSPHLFPFQRSIVEWALARGRAAIFADTGLGKTRMQLLWADAVAHHTGRPALVLAPRAHEFLHVALCELTRVARQCEP